MMKGFLPVARAAVRTASMSAARFHERLAHRIHAVLERELQAGAVVVGERADAEVDARKVEAFPGSQLAADGDRAPHVAARHLFDDELHQAVIEEEPVARASRPRGSRAKLIATRCSFPTTSSLVSVNVSPGHQLDRLRLDLADAHLGAGQIGHDGHAPAGGLLRVPDAGDARRRGWRSRRARN